MNRSASIAATVVALLEKSNLLTPEELDQVRKLLPADADAKTIGNLLIQKKLLTRWQAGQILAGRTALTLGKYRLLERLGKGGMGSVYLAEHRQMKRRAAIKTLAIDAHQDAAAESQLLAEAQAIAMLDHRNIVHAFDLEVEGDLHFLVMEYVEGEDLERLVEREGPLPFEKAADFIAQAADGLAHAHGRGLVHRDIKPANLLLERQGVIKISDFGLAHAGDQTATATRPASQTNAALGTVDYLSPEQALDQNSVDQRSDIYSLGCTFYFLLTGLPPFPEGSLAERLVKHQTEEPRSVLKLRPDTPHDLVKACRKMMAKKPDQRFASAKEVATVLRAWKPEANDASQSVLEDSAVLRAKGPSDTGASRSAIGSNKAGSPSASSIMRQVGTPTPRGGIPVAKALGADSSVSGIRRSGAQASVSNSQTLRISTSAVRKRKKTSLYVLLGGLGLFVAIIVGMMVMVLNSSKPRLDAPSDASEQAAGKSPGATAANPPAKKSSREPNDQPVPAKDTTKTKVADNRAARTTPTPADRQEPEQPKPAAKQAEPAAPRPVAPGDPFRELTKMVELPAVGRGDAESPPVTLGKLHLNDGADYSIELLGSNSALAKGAGQFHLRRQGVNAQNADWLIVFEASSDSADSSSLPVATVTRRQDDLQFRWAAGAGKTPADQLRNCILQWRSGNSTSLMRLRKPSEAQAVPVDLSKKTSVTLPCDYPPDPEGLFVEVLDLEARDVQSEIRPARLTVRSISARDPAGTEPTTIYLGQAKGDSAKPLAVRLTCIARGLGSLRLELTPLYRVNDAWAPLDIGKLTGMMSTFKTKADALNNRVGKLDPERDKKDLADAKQQLDDTRVAIADLEKLGTLYKKVNDVGRIHYRLIHRIGDQEVILTSTQAGDSN